MTTGETAMNFVDSLLEGKTSEEQIKILRNCLNHAITHPWVDDDLVESICENIAFSYEVSSPFQSDEDS